MRLVTLLHSEQYDKTCLRVYNPLIRNFPINSDLFLGDAAFIESSDEAKVLFWIDSPLHKLGFALPLIQVCNIDLFNGGYNKIVPFDDVTITELQSAIQSSVDYLNNNKSKIEAKFTAYNRDYNQAMFAKCFDFLSLFSEFLTFMQKYQSDLTEETKAVYLTTV